MLRNDTTSTRVRYVDVLKGIGMFWVVFGHIVHIQAFREYIWNFHMPLFFFVSGFLFNANKYQRFPEFLKARVKSLLIPYVIMYLVTFSYWVCLERFVRGGEHTVFSQMIGLVYGTYGDYMYFNGALWFLPCLFAAEMISYFIVKVRSIAFVGILSVLSFGVGRMLFTLGITFLSFGLQTSFIAIFFIGIGFCLKEFIREFVSLHLAYKVTDVGGLPLDSNGLPR